MRDHEDARRPRETCEQCGFDSELYDRSDTITSQRLIPAVLRASIEGLDDEALHARPTPDTWSIAEYVDHVRESAFGNRFAIETILAEPGVDLAKPPEAAVDEVPKRVDIASALTGLTDEFRELAVLLSSLDPDQWDAECTLAGETLTIGWFARHVLHDGLHHMADIGRIRFGAGSGASSVIGTVQGLHVSSGGVPKNSVGSAVVGPAGVEGDSQADRRHHGRPIQAVCLWSTEVIDALCAEGHPIHPGAAGENITVSGLRWSELRPGARIDIGPVKLLVSAYVIPCWKNAQWFSDTDFNRIHHERHPGWSRLYAIPLNSGNVAVGDRVEVEP